MPITASITRCPESESCRNGSQAMKTEKTNAGNHFILSRSQWCFITAKMICDGFAVDDRSKRAAEVAHSRS